MYTNEVRVRFAPSPTGMVHVGNIRVALFNWLFARHCGGEFLLRIEDTDKERSTPAAINAILDSLRWLGLLWDGNFMLQSTQSKKHIEAIETLIRNGDAHKCDDGTVKFRIPTSNLERFASYVKDGRIMYHDMVKGEMSKSLSDMEDFTIMRSDGSPVFHIANVVDDITQGITHVIRGDDHVENTFRHILLFRCLGERPPRYAHLPMIVNAQGKPYSKRDGDAFVGDFKSKGILPSVLLNSLALSGWTPPNLAERITRDEMVKMFTLESCHHSPSMLDMKKMLNMNGKEIAEMDEDLFFELITRFLVNEEDDYGKTTHTSVPQGKLRKVCRLMHSRTKVLSDCRAWKYFFEDAGSGEGLGEYATAFQEFLNKFKYKGFEFTVESLKRATEIVENDCGLKKGSLNQPLRMAVTGMKIGCGIHETMEAIGYEEVSRRIERAIRQAKGEQE